MIELAVIVAAVGYGAYRLVRAQAEARRYLEEGQGEAPLELDHLTPPLKRLALETRTLRISLESPIRALRELGRADIARTQEDIDAVDHALMEATRAVGEWLREVDALAEIDRQRLEDVGGSPEPVRAALIAEHGAFERGRFRVEGRPNLDVRLGQVASELARIEAALQVRSRIYR
ncbi:MAG: hypothetical protein KC420_09415 [Myxococcales bacterium]|nr:hypothetical protein [Myxococcales bacterium]MCB9704219.1 hypothetical protein [Myxococcales bacterium]